MTTKLVAPEVGRKYRAVGETHEPFDVECISVVRRERPGDTGQVRIRGLHDGVEGWVEVSALQEAPDLN